MSTDILSGTVAVIPAHDPTLALLDLVDDILRQVSYLVVVDDGSNSDLVLSRIRGRDRVEVVHQENQGIAVALNVGIRAALRLNPSAATVLTLDQDSRLPAGYVDRAGREIVNLKRMGLNPAAVCARSMSGTPVRTEGSIFGNLYVFEVAQSGMLFDVSVFRELGWFREEFFIDCVDLEFILRAHRHQRPTFVAGGCDLGHSAGVLKNPLSAALRREVTIRGFTYSSHSPSRNYYIWRNRSQVVREFGVQYPKWALRSTLLELRTLAMTLIFEPGRRSLIGAVTRGLRDSRRGRFGPDEDSA